LKNAWQAPVGLHIGSLEFAQSLRDWINDGLMTLFFLVALELKRELVLGELSNPRMAAALSIAVLWGRPGMESLLTRPATDAAA
jgi:NhaA family Na+:H+ antiporter